MYNMKCICTECSKEFEMNVNSYKRRLKYSNIVRCPECQAKYISMINKKRWENLSQEKRNEISMKRKERMINTWKNRSKDYKLTQSEKLKNGRKQWKNNLSDTEWIEFLNKLQSGHKKWEDNLTDEERKNRKKSFSDNAKKYWSNVDEIKKSEIINKMMDGQKEWRNNLSDKEKNRIYSNLNKGYLKWWNELSQEELNKISNSRSKYMKNKMNSMNDDEKKEFLKKTIANSGGNNNFHKKFENAFTESHLVNSFYFIPEYPIANNDITHCWDYGIFTKDTNELICVVDLDGAYYHADICDYDGIHSKEEYDECRAQSVPDGIHHFIIQEFRFKETFEKMIQTIMLDYDQYVENTFLELRSQPFPCPHYTDVELMKSFDKLQRMDCNDKYHQDISLNTRVGDRLIQHFHQSIWYDHVDGELSPYEAWQDDKLLHEVIKNRIIYQTYLNPNKILQGFNIAKKAPKVSVFSAGRAKMIISKYLNEFNTIFDPFSGYSGRMLGAIACGKRYIGQDISERHVAESNNIIEFLHKYGITFDAKISQQNILESNGEYDCLFTCPPYGKKEQWEDVPVDLRTCDDWIDECLQRFQCKRYIFVVDHTEKYKDNIAAEISNKSHFSNAKEYIIIIDRD